MIQQRMTAGSEIDARCTRCKLVLNHTIVAMVGSQVVRVKCNTCGGEHAFHSARPAEEKRPTERKEPSSRAAAAPKTAESIHDEWVKALNAAQGASRGYDMTAAYRSGDIVDHPSFGKGVVLAAYRPNKMEVLFKDGKKILRCTIP